MTLEEKIESKRKEVEEAKSRLDSLDQELKAMQIQALEESGKPIWERFLKWTEDEVASVDKCWVEHFYVNLDTPEGFPDKGEIDRDLYCTYEDQGKEHVFSMFMHDDVGRGTRMEMSDVINNWDDWRRGLINNEESYFWEIRMTIDHYMKLGEERGSHLSEEEKTIIIPMTLEHFDQLAEQVMNSDLRSYIFDW